MKRFVLSAAGLIAAVSMASVLATPDPVLTIKVDNSKASPTTYSVMKIGALGACSTAKAPATQGGNKSVNTISKKTLQGLCLGEEGSCTIQLMENSKPDCGGATVIGTVQADTNIIGDPSGALLKEPTQVPTNWTYVTPSTTEVDITTKK